MQPAPAVVNPGTENVDPVAVRQTLACTKLTPLMYGETVPAEPVTTEGRACEEPRSRRVSSPVMMLKGRPEESSTIGAIVKSPRKRLTKPSPDFPAGLWKTALVTQRWR